MKEFELEILNSGSPENVSILSDESMSEALGGKISCKKGFELGDDGVVTCLCEYRNDKPIIIVPPAPAPGPGSIVIG